MENKNPYYDYGYSIDVYRIFNDECGAGRSYHPGMRMGVSYFVVLFWNKNFQIRKAAKILLRYRKDSCFT